MGIRRFFWSEWGDSVHYGVDPVAPGSSNCPPDSCIELFESPHQKEKSRNSECDIAGCKLPPKERRRIEFLEVAEF